MVQRGGQHRLCHGSAAMSARSIHDVRMVPVPDPEPLGESDPPAMPRLRGRFHQVAFFVAIPAGVMLIALAHTATARTAAAVYAGSLAGLYGVSSAYHRFRW